MFFSRLFRLQKQKITQRTATNVHRAAVAIIVREDNHICMIRRPIKAEDYWSGHMAFPGGREEEADDNLLETAIRETQEEIGLTLSIELCKGQLEDLRHPKLQVSAFVFEAPQNLEMTLDPNEVADVYWLDLQDFLNPKYRRTRKSTWNAQEVDVPLLQIGTADVWGISLLFIERLLAIVKEE